MELNYRGEHDMKRLFISQPMKDLSMDYIVEVRNKAFADAQCIAGEELELINSFLTGYTDEPMVGMSKCIEILSTADVVYFVDGWKRARGCRIEHAVAVEYDMTILSD